MNNRNRIVLALLASLGIFASQAHAAYADADAVVTAVNAIPTSVTTAFLAAAALGVAFLIVRLVAKGLKKGINIG